MFSYWLPDHHLLMIHNLNQVVRTTPLLATISSTVSSHSINMRPSRSTHISLVPPIQLRSDSSWLLSMVCFSSCILPICPTPQTRLLLITPGELRYHHSRKSTDVWTHLRNLLGFFASAASSRLVFPPPNSFRLPGLSTSFPSCMRVFSGCRVVLILSFLSLAQAPNYHATIKRKEERERKRWSVNLAYILFFFYSISLQRRKESIGRQFIGRWWIIYIFFPSLSLCIGQSASSPHHPLPAKQRSKQAVGQFSEEETREGKCSKRENKKLHQSKSVI